MLRSFRLLPCAAAFLAAAAAAQPLTAPPVGAAEPLADPAPLAGYRPFMDEKLIPWKEANDNVGRIGGWRAYARESSAPAAATPGSAAPAGAAAPAAPAAPAGHGGHQH